MNEDREDWLRSAFDNACVPLTDSSFELDVMARVDAQRRLTLLIWGVAGAGLLLTLWFVMTPLLQILSQSSAFLPRTLVSIDNRWVAELLAPINGASGVAAVCFLAGWVAFRKIFR